MIPLEERYAVDRPNHTVHKPYVGHAAALPRTTYRGVMATVPDPQPCAECWPPMPEVSSYDCDRCGRRHFEGSALYVRHQEAPHDEQPVVETEAIPEPEHDPIPEPYFPPYPEDKA